MRKLLSFIFAVLLVGTPTFLLPSKSEAQNPYTLFIKGKEKFKNGDYKEALLNFNKSIELNPNVLI